MAKVEVLSSGLKPSYSFESLVVGQNNHVAVAACQAVARTPGDAYNPLYLYGPAGVGKTHLIQAVGHEMHLSNPQWKIKYIFAERFISEILTFIAEDKVLEVRKIYSQLDLLIVDDVQYLAESKIAQEELFHIFNNLHHENHQLILAADRPPNQLSGLNKNILSRLEWGLATDIQIPDITTRFEILKKKQLNQNIQMTDEMLTYAAQRLKSSVRELEGFLKRIHAYVTLSHQEITEELVKSIVRELVPLENGTLEPQSFTSLKEPKSNGIQDHTRESHAPSSFQHLGEIIHSVPPPSPSPVSSPQVPPPSPSPNPSPIPSSPLPSPPSPFPNFSTVPKSHPAQPHFDPDGFTSPVPSIEKTKSGGDIRHRPTVPMPSLTPGSFTNPPLQDRPLEAPPIATQKPIDKSVIGAPGQSPPPNLPPPKEEVLEVPPNPFDEENDELPNGYKEVLAVFFYPATRNLELETVSKKFQEVIRKHKLKFRLKRVHNEPYEFKGKINCSSFVEVCKNNKVPVAIVIGPPPDTMIPEQDFYDLLTVTLDVQGVSLQIINWSEVNKDYRYLNLALDIALVRSK